MNGSLKAVSDHNFDYWNSNKIFTGRWTKWRKWQPEIILISNSQLFPTFMSCGTNNMSGASALVCVLTLYLVACVLWQPCLFDPKINMLFQKAMKPVDKYACWIILVVIGFMFAGTSIKFDFNKELPHGVLFKPWQKHNIPFGQHLLNAYYMLSIWLRILTPRSLVNYVITI